MYHAMFKDSGSIFVSKLLISLKETFCARQIFRTLSVCLCLKASIKFLHSSLKLAFIHPKMIGLAMLLNPTK